MTPIYFKLLAPLSHGDPNLSAETGNHRLLRKQYVVGLGEVPILSGNAIRGVLRRELMRDFLTWAGMTREAYTDAPGHWDRIYAVLCNGGTLTGSEQLVNTEARRALRRACPPLSLLGSALYTFMLGGMCSILDAYPQCREVAEAGLCDSSDTALRDLYGDRNFVRHPSPETDKAETGAGNMPYSFEVLFPGTVLQGGILFDRAATEIERDCAAYGLSLLRQLGGRIAVGLGSVAVAAAGIGDPGRYIAWRDANAPAARAVLEAAIPPLKRGGRGKAEASDQAAEA